MNSATQPDALIFSSVGNHLIQILYHRIVFICRKMFLTRETPPPFLSMGRLFVCYCKPFGAWLKPCTGPSGCFCLSGENRRLGARDFPACRLRRSISFPCTLLLAADTQVVYVILCILIPARKSAFLFRQKTLFAAKARAGRNRPFCAGSTRRAPFRKPLALGAGASSAARK